MGPFNFLVFSFSKEFINLVESIQILIDTKIGAEVRTCITEKLKNIVANNAR